MAGLRPAFLFALALAALLLLAWLWLPAVPPEPPDPSGASEGSGSRQPSGDGSCRSASASAPAPPPPAPGFCEAPASPEEPKAAEQGPPPAPFCEAPAPQPEKGRYKREEACRRALEELCGAPFPPARPAWLRNPRTGRCLELDCYNEGLRLALEHNGRQHYAFPNAFHETAEDYAQQRYRDAEKAEQCRRRGVHLIVVPYDVPLAQIPAYIRERLPPGVCGRPAGREE